MPKSKTKKPVKQKMKTKEKMEELLELERLEKAVLGTGFGLLKAIKDDTPDTDEDRSSTNAEDEVTNDDRDKSKDNSQTTRKKPAWIDEEDARIEIPHKLKKYATVNTEDSYQKLLRRKFEQTMGTPKWAKKPVRPNETDNEDLDELMRCGNMLDKKSRLTKGTLKIDKMVDLNKETKIEGPLINAVEFHPTSTVAMVAGQSGVVSIIQVDGVTNSKLQTVKFRGVSIDCAHFTKDGDQFIIGSKKSRSFWYYDMMEGKSIQVPVHHAIGPLNMSKFVMSPDGKFIVICGKYGAIHLLTANTKEWVGDLKMNSDVADVTFSHDGSHMYSYSDNGEIYEWDMSSRRCVRKMFDEGCLSGITLALSPNDQILATGSSSGIVNLYEMPIKEQNMAPVKVMKNLVTSITALAFNKTSEILAFSSRDKHNAVRLIHFPSMTVFSNFPGFQNVGQPRVLSFSPLSGYFAIGTAQKTVLLYRLKHYKNY